MNEQDSREQSADELEAGERIEMLRELGEEPEPGFFHRVRAAIHRRLLASQLIDLSWFTPVLVLFEYLKFMFGFAERVRREEGDRD